MEYYEGKGFGTEALELCQALAKLIDQHLNQTIRRGRLLLARVGRARHYADRCSHLTGQC